MHSVGARADCAGMLKSFLGVSASLASTIYVASFQPDGLGFLLFVACLPVAIGLATVPFMNHVAYVEQHEVAQGPKHMSTGGSATRMTHRAAVLSAPAEHKGRA